MHTNDAVSDHGAPSIPRDASRARVLLVEDDQEMRTLLAEALRHDDFDVIEAEDGAALLDALLEPGAYRVVVADVNLPEMSGIDALAVAHLMQEDVPLPDVLLVTADTDERLLDDARVAGAVGVLQKPIDLDDLRLVVRLLVSGRARVPKLAVQSTPK